MKRIINGQRLREGREKKGMSQRDLANEVGCDIGTVSRWERERGRPIRALKLEKLSEALDVTPEWLCDSGPLPSKSKGEPKSERSQTNLKIDGVARNALEFVASRYGVSKQTIVDIAPLLFFIAAEKSLQERQEAVDNIESGLSKLRENFPNHLKSEEGVEYLHSDSRLKAERNSISHRDLFGTMTPINFEFSATLNPFARFLSRNLKEVCPVRSESPDYELEVCWDVNDSPNYSICIDEVEKFVGDDKSAARTLLRGFVDLNEMPAEIKNSTATERAEWVHEKFDEIQRRISEGLSSFLSADQPQDNRNAV